MSTIAELKDKLRAMGLPVSGTKAELIARMNAKKKKPTSKKNGYAVDRKQMGGWWPWPWPLGSKQTGQPQQQPQKQPQKQDISYAMIAPPAPNLPPQSWRYNTTPYIAGTPKYANNKTRMRKLLT